ncbi:hypothetical protein LR48_Vigan316s001400 [Vigna angularis]|uniref:Uncharacterized protein n=1 Tax=Phaseolus angularis TaxID=3914 RepID=A0A0L9T854_PHAAN|nr:hypothetical protein LR48_Vigan316s001400 [Vigna angularis]
MSSSTPWSRGLLSQFFYFHQDVLDWTVICSVKDGTISRELHLDVSLPPMLSSCWMLYRGSPSKLLLQLVQCTPFFSIPSNHLTGHSSSFTEICFNRELPLQAAAMLLKKPCELQSLNVVAAAVMEDRELPPLLKTWTDVAGLLWCVTESFPKVCAGLVAASLLLPSSPSR